MYINVLFTSVRQTENSTVYIMILLTEDADGPVGFTARTSGDVTYDADDVIQFTNVLTNFGDHYDADTGIFLCPYDGIYMFFTTLLGEGTNVAGHMIRSRTTLSVAHSHTISNSASNFAITDCSMGDKVWIRQYHDNDIVHGGTACSFSGFLLHKY